MRYKKVLMFCSNIVVEPLGLMYLIPPLQAAGYEVDIVQVDREDFRGLIKNEGPYQAFLYSVISGNERRWTTVNIAAREVHTAYFGSTPRSVFGGPHCSLSARPFEVPAQGVDVVVQGEAEEVVVRAIEADLRGSPSRPVVVSDFSLRDVRTLAHPDRAVLYSKYSYLRENSIHNLLSQRGCVHKCSFCFNAPWNQLYRGQPIVRVRDPKDVVEEIAQIKRDYPAFQYPWFVCDIFLGGRRDLLDSFQQAYAAANLKLPIFCSTRADYVDEEAVRLLKACNVYCINLALEAANDEVRNGILQKGLKKEAVVKALQLFRKYGIHVRLQNMIGLPVPRSLDDAFETLAFNYEHRPTISWSSILQPYNGTAIADYCVKNGYAKESDLVPGSFFSHSVLKIKDAAAIARLHKWWPVILNRRWLYPFRKLLVRLPIPLPLLTRLWSREKARQDDSLFVGAAHS